jgi:hypothetical protein
VRTQIFTERFAEGVLAPSARRTTRLDGIVQHLGLAPGGDVRKKADVAGEQRYPIAGGQTP